MPKPKLDVVKVICYVTKGIESWQCATCNDFQDAHCPAHTPGDKRTYCGECCWACRPISSAASQPTLKKKGGK